MPLDHRLARRGVSPRDSTNRMDGSIKGSSRLRADTHTKRDDPGDAAGSLRHSLRVFNMLTLDTSFAGCDELFSLSLQHLLPSPTFDLFPQGRAAAEALFRLADRPLRRIDACALSGLSPKPLLQPTTTRCPFSP